MASKSDHQNRHEALQHIHAEVEALSTPLADERRKNNMKPVIGEGSPDAQILFIGEAPGKNEAIQGRPFCGASGKFLNILLESAGITHDEIYITNIVKDRPTNNRDPKPDEIATYAPFLDRQIDIIQPTVIATLGRFSMVYIMEKFGLQDKLDSISHIHGTSFKAHTSYGIVHIIPLYHPAVALYNGGMRQTLIEDFKIIKKIKDKFQ